jgi:hypothetical protein
MTTDLSLKAEHECVSYYCCLIHEDVETKYHYLGEINEPFYQALYHDCKYTSFFSYRSRW